MRFVVTTCSLRLRRLPWNKSLLVCHLLAISNWYKILRIQRNMTTTTSAGIEPADFAECSHSKTMPAGIKPAGRFKKTCHEHIFATKRHSCIFKFSIASWLNPIRLHVDSRDASTCWSNTCWSHPFLLDCRKHTRFGQSWLVNHWEYVVCLQVKTCWSVTCWYSSGYKFLSLHFNVWPGNTTKPHVIMVQG